MRNEATLQALERELQSNCGDDLAAARAVGVSLIFVNQWRKDDKVTDARLTEATQVGVQGLYSAAVRRGVHGVEKPVWYKGAVVGYETAYSDGLLTTLLKGKLDDFKKQEEGGGVNVNVNVANLMPRAKDYGEWLAMKHDTFKAALPAPDQNTQDREKSLEALGRLMTQPETIDAEYEEVPAYGGIVL